MAYLVHYGIEGQKWGVRRYQNPDGTLTEAGKKRYRKEFNTLSNAYMVSDKRYKQWKVNDDKARENWDKYGALFNANLLNTAEKYALKAEELSWKAAQQYEDAQLDAEIRAMNFMLSKYGDTILTDIF